MIVAAGLNVKDAVSGVIRCKHCNKVNNFLLHSTITGQKQKVSNFAGGPVLAKIASLKRKDFNLNLFNVHTTNASKWHVEEYYCNWTQSHAHTIGRIAVEVWNCGHRTAT